MDICMKRYLSDSTIVFVRNWSLGIAEEMVDARC